MLDYRRTNHRLAQQLATLRRFADKSSALVMLIAPVHHEFESQNKQMLTVDDVRCFNPVDFAVLDKSLCIHRSRRSSDDC